MMAGSSRWGGVLLPVLLLLLLQGKGIHSFYIGSLSRMSRAAVRKFPMAGGVEVQRAPSLKSTLLEEEETITATIVQEEEAEVVEISEGMPIIQDVEDTLVDSGDVRAAPYRDVEDEAEVRGMSVQWLSIARVCVPISGVCASSGGRGASGGVGAADARPGCPRRGWPGTTTLPPPPSEAK